MPRKIVVAIDGPAGAGKSTVSKRVSEELDYLLLDTGALYRCVGLESREFIDDPGAVGELASAMAKRGAIRFVTESREGRRAQRVLLDGKDVSEQIRTQEVSTLASRVSAIPAVRAALLAMQRQVGAEGGVVVEGRDIGTVVFPAADAKFFLTASVEARAGRRFGELNEKEPDLTLEQVEEDVRERDQRDSMRPVAPLLKAEDAIEIDSTERTIDQVVADIVVRVRELVAS